MTNEQIKTVGQTIAQETTIGGNTAARVGGVVEGIGAALDNKDAAIGYFLGTISGGSIYVNAPNYLLGSGGNLKIKMPAAATSACTLTIGNAQAVQLWYNGVPVSSSNTWDAGEIVSVYYDGTRFMASNSQGGAKFSGGQKVSEITLEQTLGSGVNSVVSQKGISDAVFNEIDINDIDDLKNLADALNPSSSLKPTYYTVTAVRGSVVMKVGSMAVISDNLGYVVTEIMSTHYLLDADGYLTDEHDDAEVFTIFRSVKGNGGTLPTPVGTWTAWKYINQSVWPDVASVKQRLLAMMGYYVCDTAEGTAAKTVSASGYTLTNGGCIRIKMTNANTADNATLNINGTGAKALFYDGAQASSANTWEAGEVLEVYYDGTQYQCISGGGGKAEKVKYDNSQSGLDAANVQEAIDVVAGDLETEETKIKTGFQISTSGSTTTWYATSIGFVKGRKYRIRVTASARYAKVTSIILQVTSQQYEGQKAIGSLPANTLVAEFDYYCLDDNFQYFCIYASGGHTVTYGVIVSDCLEMGEVVEKNNMLLCPSATYVNFYMASSFVVATAPLTRGKYYSVHSGQKYRVKANSTKFATVLFLTSLPETLSNNQNLSAYKVGSQVTVDADTEKVVEVPATAGIMWVNVSSYYQGVFSNLEPVYVSIIDEGNTGFNDVTHSDNWVIKNGAFFGSNGKYVLHEGSAFKYIPVLEGEKYAVVTNTSNDCNYALMRSIPATIQHWTDIDAVGYGAIPAKQDIILEIPSGCVYLALSIANVYKDLEPIYVGKLSSDRSSIDNVIIDTGLLNNVNTKRILLFPVYGQSLAIGGDATPITTYCRFPKNCTNTNNLALQFGQSLETSVYGLVESYVDFKGQEDRIPAVRQNDKIASFSSGQGSTPISGLEKGTTLYSNLLSAITTSYNSRGQNKLIVPAFCWIQGEGDLDNGVQYYIDALSQLREDLDEDIKAITGQTEDVHCIVYQTNQLCPGSTSPWSPGKYESGSGGARFDGSVVAQWKLVRDSQYFHLSSPVYPMDFVVSPNGARIHISGMSQKYLGYYEGLAAKRLVDGHGDDIGLYVTSVTKVDNTHIRIALHAPCPPVVFDVENVEQVSHYGFSVITEEDTDIVSDVAIERNNFGTTNILITTSANCSGAKLRYGYNGTKGYSGYKQGPRGNVRDSQGLWYKAQINNIDLPMHNWLMFFEEIIPSE